MDLSIIIPSYNTSALLDRCLTSIYQHLTGSEITFEVIVVDNASGDDSCVMARKKFPRVHLVRNKANLGYGKANNRGIRIANGMYILLLNSDVIVQNDAVPTLYTFLRVNPSVFAGGKLFNEDGSPQPSCGPFFSLPVVAEMLFLRGDYWGLSRYAPDRTRQVDWISGACMMGRKSSFMEVGLFDEKIFMYMEEIDLLYRARKLGHKAFFVHDAQFIHTGAASSGTRKTPVVNIYRGLVHFYQKHHPGTALWILRVMLRIKALAGIIAGRMIKKPIVTQTYEEALRIL